MAIGIVATIKIKPGTNEAFEAVAKELMAAVRAEEPGNKVYQFCKSRTDPETYVVLETLRRPGGGRGARQVRALPHHRRQDGSVAWPDVPTCSISTPSKALTNGMSIAVLRA